LSQNENVVKSASQNRRANIIVIDKKKKNQGFNSMGNKCLNPRQSANKEKQAIYVPCIPHW